MARPRLRSSQGDLTTLLTEVKAQLDQLEVPVKGVISDGQEPKGLAVAFVFPKVPHQLCQFHSLKDAVDPLYEADRHAKTQLKKHVRGVRPLERALEERSDPEAEAMRGYCLAVRSSLTDDGRPPLEASGLKLQRTATRWPPLKNAYALVYQAAHILANHEQQTGAQIREAYLAHLSHMQEQKTSLGTLSTAIDHFVEISENVAPGLFQCYDVADLPQTNNELEHCFGVARAHERRATGRRGAIPGVVVRGSVRLMAVVIAQKEDLQAADLQPRDYQAWRQLRTQLQYRQEARRKQFRIRSDPAAYLAALEAQLLE